MMRAILAGGGVALIGAFLGGMYFLSVGGPTSSGQMTSGQAFAFSIAALLGGIGALYFAFSRLAPASSWIKTIAGWIVGFFAFPYLMDVAVPVILAISR